MAISSVLCSVGFVLLLWKACCLFLRAKRFRYMASLSPQHNALLLYKLTNFVEFGFLSEKGLEFALFKSLAIPSMSKLLHATNLLSPTNIPKRYDDTRILMEEFALHHVDSRRGSRAIQRLNFIHGHYKISNDDYLYTLSLFTLEPIRFSNKYGFRKWSEGEKQAQFMVWHDIGVRMGIKNIPESLEEMDQFSRQYEASCMVYSKSNKVVGDNTVELFLSKVHAFLRPLAKRAVYALCEERLVDAMGYPRQPFWFVWIVENIAKFCCGTFVRWFLPPRPMNWSTVRIPLEEDEEEEEGDGDEDEKVYKLRYQLYKPWTYPNGYKISKMGAAPGGRMGKVAEGLVLCPVPYTKKIY
ncbi:hypothetical protein SUGI_0963790 [Cryptomeria japonica]|uniref:ER-bound oxygenase mpaB-like n=1 Tax=Cryptomeria japonica TaxID=3369 RepID=UPI002414BC73|nr:ER-bound oxygenase mpaB-like [Cryptomeria japonica]GLJ45797.1 hypothetical protein SUGI_0963790 [Cryptomeria japonica]